MKKFVCTVSLFGDVFVDSRLGAPDGAHVGDDVCADEVGGVEEISCERVGASDELVVGLRGAGCSRPRRAWPVRCRRGA